MRKFEKYLIKIRLKANLDRLVVMHAILMIWNFKGKRIVTSFFVLLLLFFFFLKKACHRGHCPAILLESRILILLNFFWPLSLPFNSLSEEPKVEKNKMFLVYFFILTWSQL